MNKQFSIDDFLSIILFLKIRSYDRIDFEDFFYRISSYPSLRYKEVPNGRFDLGV